MDNRVIVVVGPTASGKTRLAVEIAKKYGGEIVSADSMQIYKYMDIGTAKPTEDEMQGIPHHLISIVEPTDTFTLQDELALYNVPLPDGEYIHQFMFRNARNESEVSRPYKIRIENGVSSAVE